MVAVIASLTDLFLVVHLVFVKFQILLILKSEIRLAFNF